MIDLVLYGSKLVNTTETDNQIYMVVHLTFCTALLCLIHHYHYKGKNEISFYIAICVASSTRRHKTDSKSYNYESSFSYKISDIIMIIFKVELMFCAFFI